MDAHQNLHHELVYFLFQSAILHPAERFKDKVAIVTGAGSGIGRAILLRLVTEGASVLGIDMNGDGLAETVKLASHKERISVACLSVTDEVQVTQKINEYVTLQGRLDVLANVAGILRAVPATDTSLDLFRSIIETNLVGTFLMCRICLPHLLISKGNIVNTASTAGYFGHPYISAYAASKGAVVSLTHTLAREYILQGVRVNAVAPGGIETPLSTNIEWPANMNISLFENHALPDKRMGQPENVAGVVAMLASDDGAFINGEVIRIDGGVHS